MSRDRTSRAMYISKKTMSSRRFWNERKLQIAVSTAKKDEPVVIFFDQLIVCKYYDSFRVWRSRVLYPVAYRMAVADFKDAHCRRGRGVAQ